MSQQRLPGQRELRRSIWTLIGVPVGLAFSIVWATFVKTSPTVSDDERVRGWGTVLRELPASLLLLGVVVLGLFFAVRAGRLGAEAAALRAVWLHGVALFFVLLIVISGSTENIMTTRPSTVKWILFPIEIGVTAVVVLLARRVIRTGNANSNNG